MISQEIVTYNSLIEKYPDAKLDILRLREQKMFALKCIVFTSFFIGIFIGFQIGMVI